MTIKSPGVSQAIKKDNSIYYRASITYRGKHISLGSFATRTKASLAYQEGAALLKSCTQNAEDYNKSAALSFEKWIVLLNYRDNGLYISTPIYLKKKYFLYYLSETHILKFDTDDLFYYSSHKIMKRGGHLFVADYGMQLNVLNRYGIMSYAVAGRDYFFINNDSSDLRYENIQIINRFRGVQRITLKKGYGYKVYLHIKSNYVVGTYDSEIEAAIAYNKAIDIVKKNGIDRNFTPNYIDGLSASVYANIYAALCISEKITSIFPSSQ